jgi:isoquinoline 1-oxidoreductase alpha subunit
MFKFLKSVPFSEKDTILSPSNRNNKPIECCIIYLKIVLIRQVSIAFILLAMRSTTPLIYFKKEKGSCLFFDTSSLWVYFALNFKNLYLIKSVQIIFESPKISEEKIVTQSIHKGFYLFVTCSFKFLNVKTTLSINGKSHTVQVPEDMPLLWAIRDIVGLTGTKFGCGVSQCGACSVLIDGKLTKSCSVLVADVDEKEIFTIEGTSQTLEILRQTWSDGNVPQCGYCQSGQLIAATSLLDAIEKPTDKDIDDAMSANICRCGTYTRIKKAIHKAVALKNETV